MKKLMLVIAVVGMFASSTLAHAWLICDPCIGKRMTKHSSVEANVYAIAGQNFFQALYNFERRNIGSGYLNARDFFNRARQLKKSLRNNEPDLVSKLNEILGLERRILDPLNDGKLPAPEVVISLGMKWAEAQIEANKAVKSKL